MPRSNSAGAKSGKRRRHSSGAARDSFVRPCIATRLHPLDLNFGQIRKPHLQNVQVFDQFIASPELQEQGRRAKAGFIVIGVEFQHLAIALQCVLGTLALFVEFAAQQPGERIVRSRVQPRPDFLLGFRPAEPIKQSDDDGFASKPGIGMPFVDHRVEPRPAEVRSPRVAFSINRSETSPFSSPNRRE